MHRMKMHVGAVRKFCIICWSSNIETYCHRDSHGKRHTLIPNFKVLASLCSNAGRFESHLAQNPEDRFFHQEAHSLIFNR